VEPPPGRRLESFKQKGKLIALLSGSCWLKMRLVGSLGSSLSLQVGTVANAPFLPMRTLARSVVSDAANRTGEQRAIGYEASHPW